jgi:hypothetical protein
MVTPAATTDIVIMVIVIPLSLPPCGGLLLFVGTQYLLHIYRRELMGVLPVRSPAGRTQSCFDFPDPVPAPHAHLIATFAGIEFTVRNIEFLTTQGTNIIELDE